MTAAELLILNSALAHGVDPNEAWALWQQESGGSTDPAMLGKTPTKYGRAIGPWQIMPFHNPPGTFPAQTDWALDYWRKGGATIEDRVKNYYGAGKPPPGHPTWMEYAASIRSRMRSSPYQGQTSMMPQDPLAGRYPAAYPQQGSRPTDMFAQIFSGLQGRPAPNPVAQALFAMGDVLAPPGQQTGAAQRYVMGDRQGDINTQIALYQLMLDQQRFQEERTQELATRAKLQRVRDMAASRMDDPVRAEMARSGLLDKNLSYDLGEVSELRKEYKTQEPYKRFSAARDAYGSLESIVASEDDPNNPFRAVAGVIQFIKTLDPTSTVTKTESDTVANASGPVGMLGSMWNKYVEQGGPLTIDQKEKLLDVAYDMMKSRYSAAAKTQDQYSELARKAGYDPWDVVGDTMMPPERYDWTTIKEKANETVPAAPKVGKPTGETVEDVRRKLFYNPVMPPPGIDLGPMP